MNAKPDPFELRDFLEHFRQLLQAQNPTTAGDLPPALLKYGQLCEEANHRLRECFALAQRGQYSNAVAVAEREPNLLDRCAQLEIPERDLLATVAQVVGVKPPALLNRELIAALQDAYQKGSTAASNLKLLHRLTLARAPLPTRLNIMRRLLVQDPNHPYMDADIRTFEKAWFKQANEFIQPFAKQGRPEVIQEVIQDLQEGGYLETPPPALLAQLQNQIAKARAARLPTLAAEIRRAYAEEAVWTLTQLAETWNALLGGTGSVSDEVRHGVDEALDWLRRKQAEGRTETERTEAKSRLSRLIEASDTKRVDLEAAYQTVRTLRANEPGLENQYRERLAEMDRSRTMRLAGAAGAGVLLLGLVIVGLVWMSGSADPASTPKVAAPVKPTNPLSSDNDDARKQDLARVEKQGPDRQKDEEKPREDVAKGNQRVEFDKQLATLKESSAKLVAEARRGLAAGAGAGAIADLRRRLADLRGQARGMAVGDADFGLIEKQLDEAESWRTLAVSLTAFRQEMEGVRGSNESLKRLARFLNDKIAPIAPDPELAQRAKLAQATLPTWLKTLEVQTMLQSGGFLTQPIPDDWQGQPPSGPLAAAAEYAEMQRQRNKAATDSEVAKLELRLSKMDIKNLWMIRRVGESERYYTSEQPPAGETKARINILTNSIGGKELVPFTGKLQVSRAPQSIFAERAATLWESKAREEWDDRLADVCDALYDAKDMDPLLKLDLLRRVLGLAVRTSAGYREVLQDHPGFKSVTGRAGLITGNWLNPGEDLEGPREQAAKLIAQAPRLRPLAAAAATRAEERLSTLKKGLIVTGWVCRDRDARPALAKFAGAKPAAGSRLFTVANGRWINLGSVSADGKDVRVTESAEQYVGWPVFALLVTD